MPHGQSVKATAAGLPALADIFAAPDFVQRASGAQIGADFRIPDGTAARRLVPLGFEVVVELAGVVDFAREREKLSTELTGLTKQLDALRGRLANEKFTSKAPPAVVEAERAKEREWAARAEQLAAKLASLGA